MIFCSNVNGSLWGYVLRWVSLGEGEGMNKKLPRQDLRYKREDIDVYLLWGAGRFELMELSNISQHGMAVRCRCKLRLNKQINFKIIFPDEQVFYEKGRLVSKVEKLDQPRDEKKISLLEKLRGANSLYDYGFEFNGASSDFKSCLLVTNMRKRFESYGIK